MNWTKKKRQHRLGSNGGQPFRRGEFSVISNKFTTKGNIGVNGVVDKNATWWAIIERSQKEEETRLSTSRLKPLKKKKETSK